MPIPFDFHYYWHSESSPEFAKKWIDSWRSLNPYASIRYWNERMTIEEMTNLNSDYLPIFRNCTSWYGKMRIAQYFILDNFGGVFFDIDIRCLRSLGGFLHQSNFFLGLEPEQQVAKYEQPNLVGSHLIGSCPNHKLWKTVLSMISEKPDKGQDPEITYGSVMLTRAIEMNKEWIEKEIDVYPSQTFYPLWCCQSIEEIKKISFNESYCVHYWRDHVHPSHLILPSELPTVLLTLIVRNKEHLLPAFLHAISELDYPKKKIHLYVYTSDNTDSSAEILSDWLEKQNDYLSTEMVSSRGTDISMEKVRQNSLEKSKERKCRYYFTADCDNFLLPHTLIDMISCHKPIVAPLLHCVTNPNESNFHIGIMNLELMKDITQTKISMKERGIFPVSLVRGTYLIDCRYISQLVFDRDGFSSSAKKNGVFQYVCNKKFYGFYFSICEEEERNIMTKYSDYLQKLIDAMIEDQNEKVDELLKSVY